MTNTPILKIENLVLEARDATGPLRPADGISLEVRNGETLGLIGESGSGKSLTMAAIVDLLPSGVTRLSGEIYFDGERVATRTQMRRLRGTRIGFVFQDPMSGLNPAFSIGSQFIELLTVRGGLSRGEARRRAVDLLERVRISSPSDRLRQYPHELSGGMRQRVLIAMALSLRPRLLIADEPTTGLDTTVQAEIVDLLRTIRDEEGLSVIMVTHDLGVAATLADRICVMYAGRIVEMGPAESLFYEPRHPYPASLLAAAPSLQASSPSHAIPGTPPHLARLPSGCAFHPRCFLADERCKEEIPPLVETDLPGTWSACHHWRSVQIEAPRVLGERVGARDE